MALTLYGITTCGTVKKARKWLDAREVPYDFVDLRTDPPTTETIDGWVAAFGARPMRNTSGRAYRALPKAERDGWDDATWAAKFAADPMLLKRPIILRDGEPVQVGFRGTDEELAACLLG